jgi:hypothetical protein
MRYILSILVSLLTIPNTANSEDICYPYYTRSGNTQIVHLSETTSYNCNELFKILDYNLRDTIREICENGQ